MRVVGPMLVRANDRRGENENSFVLADQLLKERVLLGCREIIEAFDGRDDIIAGEVDREKIRYLEACVREGQRLRPRHGYAADVDTLDALRVGKNCRGEMALAASELEDGAAIHVGG